MSKPRSLLEREGGLVIGVLRLGGLVIGVPRLRGGLVNGRGDW